MKTRYAAILNLVEDEEKLLPLTRRRPVASLPFASRYRLIDFPFSSLSNAKVRSAALFISGSGRSLYDHIRSGITWGLDNTAGGGVFTHSQIDLKASQDESDVFDRNYYYDHENYLKRSKAEYVVITGSRILANVQLNAMLTYHLDKNSDITVAYKKVARDEVREDTSYSGYRFEADNGVTINEIVPLAEIPNGETFVNFGLDFLLARTEVVLDYINKLRGRNLTVSVENILSLAIQNENTAINGYEYTGYMKAIEDIQSYFEANMDMLDESKFNGLFYREAPVLTKSKNSAPTYYGESSNVKNAQFANDSEIYGTVENSLVFRKNFICQDSKINNSIILQNCFVDEGADLNYVILDKRVHVEKGAKLEGTAEKPIVVPKEARVLSSGEIVEG
jgi:glucose-1-phosphate adenylyltransferase